MEAFYSSDVKSILHNKFVVVIGDSIQRAVYKDIVLLLQQNRFLSQKEMRDKGEFSFLGDELIEGGRKGEMTNGVKYTEVRQYVTNVFLVRFYFVTRCYNSYVESVLSDLKQEPRPDIIIMNSCLWDITRYGPESIVDYKKNLTTLFDRFKDVLEEDCLLIWNTTLPISNQARGGFLIPEIEFRTTTLRLDILEANYYAQSIVVEHGFDVLDLHFYLRHHIGRRIRDGIHWDTKAHRYISNIMLSHICKAWNLPISKYDTAPFSSYSKLYTGDSSSNDFDNPNFTSAPLLQQRDPLINEYRNDQRRPFPMGTAQGQRSIFQTMCRSWTTMLTTVNCCVPIISGRGGHAENYNSDIHGWRNSWDSGPMDSNNTYLQDPYRQQSQFQGRRNSRENWNRLDNSFPILNGPSNGGNFQPFPNPMLPSWQPYNAPFQANAMPNQSSFEPYQQGHYQGASHAKKRNRHRPYRRT